MGIGLKLDRRWNSLAGFRCESGSDGDLTQFECFVVRFAREHFLLSFNGTPIYVLVLR